MALNREQLAKAIDDAYGGRYNVVKTDRAAADADAEEAPGTGTAAAISLRSIRERVREAIGSSDSAVRPEALDGRGQLDARGDEDLEPTAPEAHTVVLEPTGGDHERPWANDRKVVILSDEGDIIAESD